jgi:N-acetylneuraminic acid mutarotase
MTTLVCQICAATFDSRNKLFKHVRVCTTGAAVSQVSSAADDRSSASEYYLYVVGGRQRGRTLKSVERYSFATKSWQDCPQMLENRGSHGAGSAGGMLYAVGGGGFRSNLSSCECFDGKEWRPAAPLQVSRHALAVVEAANDTIYAVGGWIDGKECSAVVEKFTTTSNAWTTVASLNQARRLHGVAAYPAANGESDLYAFGGNCDDPHWHTNTAEVYHAATDSWSFIAPMPAAGGAAAVAVRPYVFVFLHGKYVLRYDPATDNYVKLSPLPLPDWHCFDAVAVPNTTQVLLLGGVTNGRWCRHMYSYDAAKDSWEKLPSMKTARRRCASAIVPVQITSDAATEQSGSVGDSVEAKKQKIEA